MKIRSVIIICLLLVVTNGCEKEEITPCDRDWYFYLTDNEKAWLSLSLNKVFISFFDKNITEEEVIILVNSYPSLTDSIYTLRDSIYHEIYITFNDMNCNALLRLLKNLNKDNIISYATPFFSQNSPEIYGYLTPTNKIVCYTKLDDTEFRKNISKYSVTIISSLPDSHYLLSVGTLNNGFETFDVANRLYETGHMYYCHPAFEPIK